MLKFIPVFTNVFYFVFRYALWDVYKESEDNFNKVVALLMKFGLIYNINKEKVLVPWYLPETIPSGMDSKSNKDQVYYQ